MPLPLAPPLASAPRLKVLMHVTDAVFPHSQAGLELLHSHFAGEEEEGALHPDLRFHSLAPSLASAHAV